MYNQPYFIPNYYSTMVSPSMMRGAIGSPILGAGARGIGRGVGLMSKLGSGFSAIKSLNWGGFINNASKTLGVINQTIPLVRQVGPMVNNMKSMLKVASVFKDETDRSPRSRKNRQSKNSNSNTYQQNNSTSHFQTNYSNSFYQNNSNTKNYSQTQEEPNQSTTSPTFFIA